MEKIILLAEDDNDDVLAFELALKEMPFPTKFKHAGDGDGLFRMLKELLPDILFLDINMPCKDGLSCIKEIRKNPDYDNLPVIMYTSFRTSYHIDECFKNGANYYLIKTASVSELAACLKKIFALDWSAFMYYPVKSQFVINA